MELRKLYDEINKQNAYVEELVLKSIELVNANTILPRNKHLKVEYNLVVLSDHLVNRISLIKKKRDMCIQLINMLGPSHVTFKTRNFSFISSSVIKELKKHEFHNNVYGNHFRDNMKQLEYVIGNLTTKNDINDTNYVNPSHDLHTKNLPTYEHISPYEVNPWINEDV